MNIEETLVLRAAHRSEASVLATMSRLHVEHGLAWRWTPARIRNHIRSADSMVLVASLDGVIEGFAIMIFGDSDAHLLLLAVQPRTRNAGMGRSLLEWLEKTAETAGINRIRLEVRADNRAARCFYESMGYRPVSRVAKYYDRRETAIVMVRSLDRFRGGDD